MIRKKRPIIVLKKFITDIFALFFRVFKILIDAQRKSKLKVFLYAVGLSIYRGFYYFRDNLNQNLDLIQDHANSPESKPQWLRQYERCIGLHQLLDLHSPQSFSILILINKPQINFLKETILSCIYQTAPQFEIFIGYLGQADEDVYHLINNLKNEIPKANQIIREITLHPKLGQFNGSTLINLLANESIGTRLIIVRQHDYLRSDLLYRYAQTLSFSQDSSNLILYCDEYKFDSSGQILPGSLLRKPFTPPFPYLFSNFIANGIMVPKNLWRQAGGLDPNFDDAKEFELILRLDLFNAQFKNIPIPLYGQHLSLTKTKSQSGAKALQKYLSSKNIPCNVTEGLREGSYKVTPPPKSKKTYAIMPFKDQKDMTIQAVKALLAQENISKLEILCIDNNSTDEKIIHDLQALGAKTLVIKEPFNYSRINNLAIQHLKSIQPDDLILLINNDVVLEPKALEEMIPLTDLPKVGIVGCLLTYPNGRIQHGGIYIEREGKSNEVAWRYYDGMKKIEEGTFSSYLMPVDAVTAACALLTKRVFDEVQGFDEALYPIAFSDTDLCIRINQRGYYALYTPFAKGVHYESASRGRNFYEDFEGSTWLKDQNNRFFESKTSYYL